MGEEGWCRLWELRGAATHPTVMLTRLKGVVSVEPMMCSASNAREKWSETWGTSAEWINA